MATFFAIMCGWFIFSTILGFKLGPHLRAARQTAMYNRTTDSEKSN